MADDGQALEAGDAIAAQDTHSELAPAAGGHRRRELTDLTRDKQLRQLSGEYALRLKSILGEIENDHMTTVLEAPSQHDNRSPLHIALEHDIIDFPASNKVSHPRAEPDADITRADTTSWAGNEDRRLIVNNGVEAALEGLTAHVENDAVIATAPATLNNMCALNESAVYFVENNGLKFPWIHLQSEGGDGHKMTICRILRNISLEESTAARLCQREELDAVITSLLNDYYATELFLESWTPPTGQRTADAESNAHFESLRTSSSALAAAKSAVMLGGELYLKSTTYRRTQTWLNRCRLRLHHCCTWAHKKRLYGRVRRIDPFSSGHCSGLESSKSRGSSYKAQAKCAALDNVGCECLRSSVRSASGC